MNIDIKQIMPQNRHAFIFWIALVIIAFIFGMIISGNDSGTRDRQGAVEQRVGEASLWTCSMHPNIQQPRPGKCPICGMDLISVVRRTDENLAIRQISLSENARKLAEVEVAPVQRKFVTHEIRLVGKIDYDETSLRYITAWVPGRIDRMFVNYTGIPVRKGDHLVEIYSPELLATQQELIESMKATNSLQIKEAGYLFDTAQQQLNSVRERLRLWGLTNEQITQMEKSQQPLDRITIYSPTSGIVLERYAFEGDYVNVGTKIYAIADLSKVWVKMDAYESDLAWLHYGQEVEFETEAFPGEIFKGRIAFIDPILNAKTRTAKLRVNVDNSAGKLKPEMFVHAVVRVRVAQGGKVMDPGLAGKWISPMHPEVIKDRPGTCDVCGMPLVRAEQLGYVSAENITSAPLVIPASAPLITGKRAVVYVELPDRPGTYEGREIELGPRAGDYYVVKSGLSEGEKVVVKGNFKIDSAVQIQAQPSMMNPEGRAMAAVHNHGGTSSPKSPMPQEDHLKKTDSSQQTIEIPSAFKKQLDDLYVAYFELQYSLSHDQFNPIASQAAKLLDAVKKVDMKLLKGAVHNSWMNLSEHIAKSAASLKAARDIEAARKEFDRLSQALIHVAKTFGSEKFPLLVYHCPMAFDNRGADWLQNKKGTENPYFGSAMFSCGSQTLDLTSEAIKKQPEEHRHE